MKLFFHYWSQLFIQFLLKGSINRPWITKIWKHFGGKHFLEVFLFYDLFVSGIDLLSEFRNVNLLNFHYLWFYSKWISSLWHCKTKLNWMIFCWKQGRAVAFFSSYHIFHKSKYKYVFPTVCTICKALFASTDHDSPKIILLPRLRLFQ